VNEAGAVPPASPRDDEDFEVVERPTENLSDQASTPQPSMLPIQNTIHIRGSASGETVQSPESRDDFSVSVPGPANDLQVQGPISTDAPYIPVTASRDAVGKRSPGLGDDSPSKRVSGVHDQETSVREPPDKRNNSSEVESDKIAWLLGDDGLESSKSAELLPQDSTPRPEARDLEDVRVELEAEDGELVERTMEELVGAASPLANLPTETDIDELIDLLRASPSSSRPISHTSTISINDILDEDSDLEATVDLDHSLFGLLDGSVDDVEELVTKGTWSEVQSPWKFHHPEELTFRNTDRQGFGFGLGELATDRKGEDVTKQTKTSKDGTSVEEVQVVTDNDLKNVDVTINSESTGVMDHCEITSDSSTIDINPPQDISACDSRHDGEQHDDISRTVADPNEKTADVPRQCTLSEVPPQSSDAMEEQDHRDNITGLEALGKSSVPASVNDAEARDLTGRQEEPVDSDVDDGQSVVKSTASIQQNEFDSRNSQKAKVISRVRRLSATDQPFRPAETDKSKVKPIVRRKSLEWIIDAETPKSTVEVGKDNVTALTAYFEEVHADQCTGCTICLTGNVERPFVVRRRSSLPGSTGSDFTSSDDFVAERNLRNFVGLQTAKPAAKPAQDHPGSDNRTKPITIPEPVSDSDPTQPSNSLSASFAQTTKSSPNELEEDHTSGVLTSFPMTERERDFVCETSNEATSTTSRRVVSLPDMTGESAEKSRDGKTRPEFRFRLARIHSHSLRSFKDINAGTGTAKTPPITSGPFEHVAIQQQFKHLELSAEREQSANRPKVGKVGELVDVKKSIVSKLFEPTVASQRSTERRNSADEIVDVGKRIRTAGPHVTLDTLIAELCAPTVDNQSSSLTPDMIQKYRIEPRRRGPAPAPPPRRGVRRLDVRGRDPRSVGGEVSNRQHGGLEQRIDAMLIDADRRWSDDEWQRPARRNVPRTTVSVPAVDLNLPYSAQQVSDL